MRDSGVFLGDSIAPLPAAASRSLPAVASHAIGFAEPRPSARSPGSGACEDDGGASTAAIVDFPAQDMPVINTALIGVYRRPTLKAAPTSFAEAGLGWA